MAEANPGRGDLEPALSAGAARLGVTLDARQRGQLLEVLAELEVWNGRFNLTGVREPADMLRKHLLDSLSVLPHLRGRRIADVGTGAGFPGLPLAITRPAVHFTLIEATAKKARFIEHVVQQLGLPNVSVVNERAEAYRPAAPFDCVVCRAVGKLVEFTGFAGHLCARGGCLLAMKGTHPADEIAALPAGWKVTAVHALDVPGLDAERHLVVLSRP